MAKKTHLGIKILTGLLTLWALSACNASGQTNTVVAVTTTRNAFETVGQINQDGNNFTIFGFLTHIDGLTDDQLFTNTGAPSEATARFTFSSTATGTSRFLIGNEFIVTGTGT